MELKKIWAVSSGSYSDYSVDAIFESKELAEEYIKVHFDANNEVEEITYIPAGFELKTWERLKIAWREPGDFPSLWGDRQQFDGGMEEEFLAMNNVDDAPMPKCDVYKATSLGPRDPGYLSVTSDDHERCRKVFTEQLAGYKLEIPLLRAAYAKLPTYQK